MPGPYESLQARRVTIPSRAGWDRWLAANRVTFTAVVEAMGEAMAAGNWPDERGLVERAGQIDRERNTHRR